MKLDKFLAALFSKKVIAVILIVVIAAFCLTACQLTIEDVFCLTFFGCFSFDTCHEMIIDCDCDCFGAFEACDDGGENSGCDVLDGCLADSYNGCFGCIWEGGLKDCRPSTVCSRCEGEDEDEYESNPPASCDECMIDCIDSCLVKMY